MSKFFHGHEHDFKKFNQGVKRPTQCYAKGIIFEKENSEKIVGIECGCGKKHPVETEHVFGGSVNGFEAIVDPITDIHQEKVNWEKELGYKPGYWQSGGY